jgi:hypothetical protein
MHLRRIQTLNSALKKSSTPSSALTSPSEHTLRQCQRVYLGESNARRMLKRAQLSKHSPEDDPIFSLHEEAAAQEAATAITAPFEQSPKSSSSTATGYSVQCYATHQEDEQKRKNAEAVSKEVKVLFNSINSSRRAESAEPLRLKALLCNNAQEQADELYFSSLNSSSVPYVPHVTVHMSRSGRRRATLISPPRTGALACGEMWYGGKYRRHLYSVRTVDEESGALLHPEDCPCHLRIVFETMVDAGWTCVGIGLGGGGEGRWVVELGE